MARRLFQAAALALLVVCSASLIADSSAPVGLDRVHVGPGSIAAGGAHTVLATPDGRVFAWGAGDRGQLGNGTLGDRWTPTAVPDLAGIVTVTAGRAHSVAVSEAGDVYAWGANTHGRLGDGTQKTRSSPVRVKGISNVRMVTAGRAHTLALTVDGRVYAWGRNTRGQLGIGRKNNALVPVQVPGLSGVVSIAAGDSHSLAVTNDGRVFAWGRNMSSALGDGTTKDRATPVAIGLAHVVSVAAGGAHSLALVESGAVYSWGRGANGELGTGSTRIAATPKLIPALHASAIVAGRHFSAAITTGGRLMAWGANGSGQLGDGTLLRQVRPAEVSGLESVDVVALGALHAAAVTTSGDVRTWGEGASGRLGSGGVEDRPAPVEVMADVPDWGRAPGDNPVPPVDATPPTIVASTSPPLTAGWMTNPVTVSFVCTDDVEIASCSGPVTVTADGVQHITGTAVDRAGNTASATVVVNLDRLPPVLSVLSPGNAFSTPDETIAVTTSVVDAGAGIADVRCDGASVADAGGQFGCTVPLMPGRNDIVLQATDILGHAASTAILVTRIGTSSALTLTPATRRMAAGDVTQLSLRDDYGAAINEAFWSSTNEAIVSLTDDDPPVLTAVGIGTAVIRAEKQGLIAEASITVVPVLMAGDTRWTLPSTPQLSVEPPLFANRVALDVPHVFTVESEDWGQALLRAVSSEGEVLWQQHVSGVPFLGDSFGGVVAGGTDENGDFRSLLRVGGGTTKPWRYDSAGILERPAQAHDGTLYAIESVPVGYNHDGGEVRDKYALAIDGASGRLMSRTRFAPEIDEFISARDGDVILTTPPTYCRSYRGQFAPLTVGPVAGADGRGYFIVRRHEIVKRDSCVEPFRRRADRTITMGLDLIIISRDAPAQSIPIFSTACEGALGTSLPCDFPVHVDQLMPDGVGGTLVTWKHGTQMVGQSVFVQKTMTRVDEEGALAESNVAPNFSLEMMGQGGTAFTYGDGWKVFDVRTGETKWSSLLPGMTPMAARPDGGVAMFDWSTKQLKLTDAIGTVESSQPFNLDWRAVNDTGDWIGLRGSQLAAVAGYFDDATRWSPIRGDAQGRLTVRRPGMGITLKSQKAKEPVRIFHTAIKIAPINQAWLEGWYGSHPELQPRRDLFGNLFITLGAGLPNGQDTASDCFIPGTSPLVSDTNRDGDVNKQAWRWTALPVSEASEADVISRLLHWHESYTDNALYACFPEDLKGFYNSNSYVHSLLIHAQVAHDDKQPLSPSPGWLTKIPLDFFPPR